MLMVWIDAGEVIIHHLGQVLRILVAAHIKVWRARLVLHGPGLADHEPVHEHTSLEGVAREVLAFVS
jgi:hypothetical protein